MIKMYPNIFPFQQLLNGTTIYNATRTQISIFSSYNVPIICLSPAKKSAIAHPHAKEFTRFSTGFSQQYTLVDAIVDEDGKDFIGEPNALYIIIKQ